MEMVGVSKNFQFRIPFRHHKAKLLNAECMLLLFMLKIWWHFNGCGYAIKFQRKVSSMKMSVKDSELRFTNSSVNSVVDGPTQSSHFNNIGLQLDYLGAGLSFTVLGKPMPLGRHRTTKTGITYNPAAKMQNEFLTASLPWLPTEPLEGPLHATLLFYFQRPKNHYSWRKNCGTLKPNMEIFYNNRVGELNFLFR